jgi:hypothetical protein
MERMLNQQEGLAPPDPAAAPPAAPAQPGTAPDAGAVPDPEPAAEAPAVSDEDMLKQLQQGPAK